jgi:formylglycine-generating enzyme
MKFTSLNLLVLTATIVLTTAVAQAVTIETVPVGNINNAADATTGNLYGSVDHAYAIGKYEVTAGQYCEFLNNKAKCDGDLYGLYNTDMWSDTHGCKIQRSGGGTVANPYIYTVAADYANRPVNYVSFWDAARFTNWLSNGQGIDGNTETGAYTLNGYNDWDGHMIVKNAGASWWIPSDNEWYKSAYNNGGSATTDYFLYPTRSNTEPGQDIVDVSGNNANCKTAPYVYPIDSGKFTTLVGEFQNSPSPYGTFDQGGNVWEWNDSVIGSPSRGLRGGSFDNSWGILTSSERVNYYPMGEGYDVGFRVASVPEPASLLMTALIAVTGLMYWWRK